MRRRTGGFFVLVIGLFLSLPLTRRNNVVNCHHHKKPLTAANSPIPSKLVKFLGGEVGRAQLRAVALAGENEGGELIFIIILVFLVLEKEVCNYFVIDNLSLPCQMELGSWMGMEVKEDEVKMIICDLCFTS